jgi:hypothetical protein
MEAVMKKIIRKFTALFLFTAVHIASMPSLQAQHKLVGELTVVSNKSGAVTVNGEPSVSGRSIVSPSEIATISLTTARISIPKTGIINLSPNTKIKLSFTESNISIDLLGGEFTIDTVQDTAVNILTSDGVITVSDKSRINAFRVKSLGGNTTVNTTTGELLFNNIAVAAGESFPRQSGSIIADDSGKDKAANNSLLLIGLLGAGAAVAVLILVGMSGSGNNPAPVLSPVR